MTNRSYAFKGYASSYNAEFLNSFNPELQPKIIESVSRNNLKDFLSELNCFKCVTKEV